MCDKGLVEDEFQFKISCTAYEKPRDHLISTSEVSLTSKICQIRKHSQSCHNGDYEFTKAVYN